MYVTHPLIKPDTLEARAYQVNIAAASLEASTLVVLPTGMGKTVIATMVIAEVLQKKGGKVLFMAPTKPLVEQHANTMRDFLTVGPVTMFTGEMAPHERLDQWKDSPVIVSTPQVILNDLISGSMTLDDFNLVIYDEAHRAAGNYAYVFIAEKYRPRGGLALGITASPGSTAGKILEVCNNLDMRRVEIRREYDPDVAPYVHDVRIHWMTVEVPPDLLRVMGHLKAALKKQVAVLQGFGLVRKGERHSIRELLDASKTIRQRIAASSGRPANSLFHAASVQAAAVEINHALELIETQGTAALNNYLDRIEEKANGKGSSRAAHIVMMDEDVIKARYISKHLAAEHPKLEKAASVVSGQLRLHPDSRIIVFTHYRDTSDLVAQRLEKVHGCRPVRFIGQASRGEDQGLTQKEQADLIVKFKKGDFNVLVATSVGEEGLDIPSTELVVFYEPVPSEIRTIQRRGRTGRKMPGRVVILMAKGTRDEAYYWSSRRKEARMMEELDLLRRQLSDKIEVGFPSTTPAAGFAAAGSASGGRPEPAAMAKADRAASVGSGPEMAGDAAPERPAAAAAGETERQAGEEGPSAAAPLQPGTPLDRKAAAEEAGALQRKAAADEAAAQQRRGQLRLVDFAGEQADERLTIIVDHREFNSGVVRELSRNDVVVVPRQLGVADFILSDRVGVERKEVRDFIGSLLEGRLFVQLKNLRGAYMRPLLVVEGEDLLSAGGVSLEAIMGALASIVTDYGIPAIFTKNDKETAALLMAIAKREHGEGRIPAIRGDKGALSLPERQQFIIEGLPHVSGTLSQRLLAELGSVQRVFNADVEELCKVKGVGKKTAEEIFRTVRADYLAASGDAGEGQAGKEGDEGPEKDEKAEEDDGEG